MLTVGAAPRARGARTGPGAGANLVLEHVTMVRRGLTLVDDLSLTVRPGQTLAVTGPSGAGKTTLLRAVSGLSPTDGGTVARPAGRLSQVFQEPRLLPWYSAHRNVSLIVDGPAPGPTAARWLERVGLAGAGHLPPARLSGGMRQRVAIARALLRDTPVVVLDEATTGLDPAARALVLDAVDRLARGRTTLIVTHDADVAVRADRVVWIEDGRVVLDDSPERLLARSRIFRSWTGASPAPGAHAAGGGRHGR